MRAMRDMRYALAMRFFEPPAFCLLGDTNTNTNSNQQRANIGQPEQ